MGRADNQNEEPFSLQSCIDLRGGGRVVSSWAVNRECFLLHGPYFCFQLAWIVRICFYFIHVYIYFRTGLYVSMNLIARATLHQFWGAVVDGVTI